MRNKEIEVVCYMLVNKILIKTQMAIFNLNIWL